MTTITMQSRPLRDGLVDARPVWAQVHEIMAAGWTKKDLAREFGLVRFHIAVDAVTATTAAAVADLHRAVTVEGHRPGAWRDPIAGLLNEIADIIRAREAPWRNAAACRGMGVDRFFRDDMTGPSICDLCPVYDECAAESANASDGWWAGLDVGATAVEIVGAA